MIEFHEHLEEDSYLSLLDSAVEIMDRQSPGEVTDSSSVKLEKFHKVGNINDDSNNDFYVD